MNEVSEEESSKAFQTAPAVTSCMATDIVQLKHRNILLSLDLRQLMKSVLVTSATVNNKLKTPVAIILLCYHVNQVCAACKITVGKKQTDKNIQQKTRQ